MVVSVASFMVQHALPRTQQLSRRYPAAEGSSRPWVLVTGASDGIGAEYCRQLAADGFNICLVSRTLSKMQEVSKQINQVSPAALTRIIVADFCSPEATKPEFFRSLLSKVKDLDLVIVVANAGLLSIGRFEKISGNAI